jgi:hypothetical protein
MVDVADVEAAPPPPKRRRTRRFWVVLAVVAVVVAAASITGLSVSFRYLHAAPLTTTGGGWTPPDNKHVRMVRAGSYISSIAVPRPGHSQTFELEVFNNSSVSQTVLGLTDGKELGNPREKAEPVHLTITTTSGFPYTGHVRYTSRPVTLAPHTERGLRLTIDTADHWQGCRSEYWQGLSLQVRVGIFTRTEWLDFDDLILELRSPGRGC